MKMYINNFGFDRGTNRGANLGRVVIYYNYIHVRIYTYNIYYIHTIYYIIYDTHLYIYIGICQI